MKLVLFLIWVSVSSNLLKQSNDRVINLVDYGAIADDGLDDHLAFKKIFDELKRNPREVRIILPKGIIDIENRLFVDFLEFDLCIEGSENSTIRILNDGFAHIQPLHQSFNLEKKAIRNDLELSLIGEKLTFIKSGYILHVQSNSIFEKGWNYKENDIHRIKSSHNGKITLLNPLLFNYDPEDEQVKVRIFKKVEITLRNLKFQISPKDESKRTTALVLAGASLQIENISVDYLNNNSYFHNGLAISASVDSKFKNITLKNLQYGVLINFVRNLTAINTKAYYVRHAYVPSTASINIFIDSLYGEYCHSVMDSHVSFNVHYKNVVDSLPTKYPDCRALGTFIENARIIPGHNLPYNLYAYWSVQTLTNEYSFLYKEYDTRFKNVHFVAPKPGRLNGLTSYTIRRLIVENCVTHNVAYYGDQNVLQKIEIKDSELGMLYVDGQKTEVSNTEFRGYLFHKAPFVMKFSGSGEVRLENIKVSHYDPTITYLFFNYHNQARSNSMKIYKSDFGPLKAWTNKLVDKGFKYDVDIKNSNFSFVEEIQDEIENVKPFIKKIKK